MSDLHSGAESRRAATATATSETPERATEGVAGGALEAASALHDMAGPLTYLLANLEHLDRLLSTHEHDLPPGRAGELRQCLREATVGAKRVRDIARDLTGPTPSGTAESDIDVHRVLLSCIKVARTEVDHRARVITDFDAIPPLSGSESRLSRLFLNLLVNAAQAVSSDAGKEHFIRVATRSDAERGIIVEIADSGPGIPAENLERLFEPFFTTKPANQGTGLGLSICRSIIDEFGGTISVDSVVGQGSTFRVMLPVQRTRGRTVQAPSSQPEARFAASPAPVRRLPQRQVG